MVAKSHDPNRRLSIDTGMDVSTSGRFVIIVDVDSALIESTRIGQPRTTGKAKLSKKAIQISLVLVAILLVPIVPFLWFGDTIEPWIESQLENPDWASNPFYTSLGVIGCLVADIFLPIPSSNVCTFAGRLLGGFVGTVICWIGLNVSCAVGYYLASWFGWPLARKLSSEQTLDEMESYVRQFGAGTLILFRAVPVLAEASVLLMGIYRLPARRFWPPVIVANLGLAVAYAYLGEYASKHGWFGLAMSLAFALPAGLMVVWWVWRRRSSDDRE